MARQQRDAGYDMIKMIQRVDPDVYRHMVHVARRSQMPVVGHVVSNIGLARTLAAGQVSLEHAGGLYPTSGLRRLFGSDSGRDDEGARAIAASRAWVGTIASSRDGDCAPPTARMRAALQAFRRARVRILAGSDAGIGPVPPGIALACELKTLVAAGYSPFEALQSATANAGAFARSHLTRATVPFGTVTTGARADLLLLSTDPRANIEAIARPAVVIVRSRGQST